MKLKPRALWIVAGVTTGLLTLLWLGSRTAVRSSPTSVIVQGKDTKSVGALILESAARSLMN